MQTTLRAAQLRIADALPGYQKTFSTADLVAYGAATWDWHRLHYDLEYVRSRDLPNVIVDGQVFGALFARQAIRWAGPRAFVVRMNMRMRSMTFAGDTLQGSGEVADLRPEATVDIAVLAQRLLNGERLVAECATEVRLPR